MGKYDSIINLPHHQSPNRRQMSLYMRAAQFMAFTPLETYEKRIHEAQREVSPRMSLSLREQEELSWKLNMAMSSNFTIDVVYFVPDKSKDGGEYLTYTGRVRKVYPDSATVQFVDDHIIPLADIYSIESPDFDLMCVG